MTYKEYLKTEHQKYLRSKKIERHPYCALCKTTKYLQVHHLYYGGRKGWYGVKLRHLRVLCRSCHILAHKLIGKRTNKKYQGSTQKIWGKLVKRHKKLINKKKSK